MPLTDTMLRNLKSDGTPAKLADSEGLYLYLSTSGGKLWRMDYRYAGKRKTLSFGAYPAVSLKDARRKRDKAKELLANNIDPGAQKKAAKEEAEAAAREQALTFAVVAREWFATKQDSYAAANIKKKQWLISLLNERIGEKPISKLVPADILNAIRPVEAAGHSVTAADSPALAAISFSFRLSASRKSSSQSRQSTTPPSPIPPLSVICCAV